MWLYDEESLRETVLRDWFYESLHSCKEKDDQNRQTQKNCKNQCEYCKSIILGITEEENCPIILSKLTFSIFSYYISTRRNTDGSLKSRAFYGGLRAALMDIYRLSSYKMEEKFQKDLSIFMGGMKREVIREKIEKGISFDEGKRPMSFEVYKRLCETLFFSEETEDVFCHLFLVLEWNLMARSENCLQMSLTHIQWKNDSLIFFFGKTKRNQEGDGNHHPWHVYSNPFEPAICPVLALGRYILTYPNILLDEKASIFPGTSQYSRFRDRLNKALVWEGRSLQALGVDPNSFGTHSIRKGAISLVSAGCTVSPPMAAICLRAAWSMGNVKDRYIHYEKAGDEFVGRTVTGISSLTRHFAVSPIYFEPGADDTNENMKREIEKLISDTCVEKEKISSTTYFMLKFVVANICFNYDYLNAVLSQTHCIRSNPLFVALGSNTIRKYAVYKYPWCRTNNTPVFTGIPPHVVVMSELEAFKSSLEAQTGNLVGALKSEMDKRGLGGEGFQARILLEDMKSHQHAFFERVNTLLSEGARSVGNGTGANCSIVTDNGFQNDFIVLT